MQQNNAEEKKGRKKTNKTAVVSYLFLFVLLFRFVLFTLLKWAAFYRCQNSRNPFVSRLFFSNVIWFRIKLVIIKVPSPSNYSNNTMFHSNWNNGDKSWRDLLSNPGSNYLGTIKLLKYVLKDLLSNPRCKTHPHFWWPQSDWRPLQDAPLVFIEQAVCAECTTKATKLSSSACTACTLCDICSY